VNIAVPAWVHNHLLLCFVLLWVGSNLVMAMPSPGPNSGAFYKWLFASLHAIFGSVPRLIATIWPGAAKFVTFGSSTQDSTPKP
jgi:hypothetical protein